MKNLKYYVGCGHPCIFKYSKRKYYLFYQGNNDKGRTWKLSNQKIKFKKGLPILM